MRITFVVPGFGGGGGWVITQYAKGLLERDHDVQILYPRGKFNMRSMLRAMYQGIRYPRRNNWVRTFHGKVVKYGMLTPELVGRNDAVIGVGADCVLAIAGLPDSCGVKIHNSHGRELHNMERMCDAWRLKMPRIVVASHLEREMRERGSTDDIYVVHNGVDRNQYYPSVPAGNRRGVGTVFHGAYTKGPDTIISVFQRLAKRSPDSPLMLFGGYPQPAGLPKGTRYVRLPSISVARDMYSRADVWFCASRSEGFPGPVLEAMACGCAVVSTDCGGTADQIEDGINGFLVPVDDAEQITDRILNLLDDSLLRQKFVAASAATLARFTWLNAIRDLEKALSAIVAH